MLRNLLDNLDYPRPFDAIDMTVVNSNYIHMACKKIILDRAHGWAFLDSRWLSCTLYTPQLPL